MTWSRKPATIAFEGKLWSAAQLSVRLTEMTGCRPWVCYRALQKNGHDPVRVLAHWGLRWIVSDNLRLPRPVTATEQPPTHPHLPLLALAGSAAAVVSQGRKIPAP